MDEVLPRHVRQVITKAKAWNNGSLVLQPRWSALNEGAEKGGGLYFLGLPNGLRYPSRSSRIIYIGSSLHLRKRLGTHSRKSNLAVEILRHFSCGTLLAAWWDFPRLSSKDLEGLEAEAILSFDAKFGSIPIGNSEVPEPFSSVPVENLIEIIECEEVTKALDLDSVADSYAFKVNIRKEIARRLPGGDFGFSIALDLDNFEAPQLVSPYEFRRIVFADKEYGTMSDVKKLEAAGNLEGAETLLLKMISQQEKRTCLPECGVSPGYYERLAILYRKAQRHREEVEILERFLKYEDYSAGSPEKLRARLEKARQLSR